MNSTFEIGNHKISRSDPAFFIADIAANHDGDIERAKDLIYLAKESGADAAKFQHFNAKTIVSDFGFKSLNLVSHQTSWKKSVFEIYQDASINLDWTQTLKDTCDKAGIIFFTSPYSFDLVDHIDPFVEAYKIGSGDITWIEMIKYIANKKKPLIIASGASSIDDVERAVNAALLINPKLCLMQCNTNYTANLENFKYINLNVLNLFYQKFPQVILGLSDHTPGHSTVLGAVSLGARMIEKHFTDDNNREGPDHKFSMNPSTWSEMVHRTRELENALGNQIKKIEDNEKETAILQRRSIRLKKDLNNGTLIQKESLELLRPCPTDAIPPFEISNIIGKKLKVEKKKGDYLKWIDIE